MRHGEALPQAAGDYERCLTEYGARQVVASVRRLLARDLNIELLLVSPYVRARQTADIANELLGGVPLVVSDAVIPEAGVAGAVEALEQASGSRDCIMVVMHQPIIGSLVYYLTGERRPMPTASVAVIETPADTHRLVLDCCNLECVI